MTNQPSASNAVKSAVCPIFCPLKKSAIGACQPLSKAGGGANRPKHQGAKAFCSTQRRAAGVRVIDRKSMTARPGFFTGFTAMVYWPAFSKVNEPMLR